MKTLISILSLLLGITSVSAQTTVSGSVANKAGDALAGSTVLFVQADTVAGGTVTDSKGRFELKGLPKGDYECKVSMLGYKAASQKFTLTEKVKLPKFELEEDATVLGEVTVTGDARKITKERAGMSIYYLTEQAKNEPNAYLALLEIPRLNVDVINRSISLDNGTVPLILVDGVKKPLDVLSPEMIESVEVIDNPSARYRSDSGVASVLNIKLKKEGIKPYMRGDLGVTSMPNANFIYTSGAFEVGTATSSVYLNAVYWRVREDRDKYYTDNYQGNIHKIMNGDNTSRNGSQTTINFGGDKLFSKKNYLAYGLRYYAHPYNSNTNYSGEISNTATGETSPLISLVNSHDKNKQFSGNIYYKHSFTDDRTLEISGDYYYSLNGNTTDREETSDWPSYTYKSSIDLDNSRHMGELYANYSDMLTESMHLDAGSNTEYAVTNIDDRLDQWPNYRYRRTREYLFAGIDNNQSDSRFYYMVSLGLDMVFSDAEGVKNSYIDFLPYASIYYNITDHHSLDLRYSRRRQMPSAGNLNPRNTSTDLLVVNKGNPLLKPSHFDQVYLGYTLRTGNIRLNSYVNYTYFSDQVRSYQYMEDDVVVKTYQNFGHSGNLSAGVTFNYNFPRKNDFRGNLNADIGYGKNFIKGMAFKGSTVTASFRGSVSYKKFYLTADLRYSGYVYQLYIKSSPDYFSAFNLGWRISNSVSVKVAMQKYLCSKAPRKSWTKSTDYSSYSRSVRLTRTPELQIGISYTFQTKNFKWRNKKQFNSSDNELQTITTH